MTLPMQCAVIRLSLVSIADTLQEEFANKGLQLCENIYIDSLARLSVSMCQCLSET